MFPECYLVCSSSLKAKLSNWVLFSSFVAYKNAGVRKASVLALQNLYEVDDNVPSLGLFTERFSNRMIELADDIDISVAVCGIGLVKQLLRYLLVIKVLKVCFSCLYSSRRHFIARLSHDYAGFAGITF